MKPFYELYRDYEKQILITRSHDCSFPPHFHGSVEIIILLDGKYSVTMDNKSYIVEGKSVIISDSFCIHSFTKLSNGPSESMLIIVPSAFLSDFEALKKGQTLSNSVINDEAIVDEISFIAENMLKHDDNDFIKQKYVDVILNLFLSKVRLTSTVDQKNNMIIKDILLYIADNFRDNITLNTISKYFGYSTSHLSRMFHSYFKISIPKYISNMRIQYIEVNRTSENKLTSLIYDAGFKSPQTYYRNLKSYLSKK